MLIIYMVRKRKHTIYLNRLMNSLDEIDEDPYEMDWIMREGIWYNPNSKQQNKLCDLICVYQDRSVSCIELKPKDTRHRQQAIDQLYNSSYFVKNVLGYGIIRRKIAYYENGFSFEEL